MTKQRQSSRYLVITFLIRDMGLNILEATQVVKQLEDIKLITFSPVICPLSSRQVKYLIIVSVL